jgi:outer membrane lipoprotein carrier protein
LLINLNDLNLGVFGVSKNHKALQMMKKLLVLISSVGTFIPAFGQKATDILAAVNKKYTSLSSYSADFKMGTTSGTLLAKGNKYKISLDGQDLYNNGKDVYTYISETNEVNITKYRAGDESDFSPNTIFNLYKKGYTPTYKQEIVKGGKKYDVVTLTPKTKSSVNKIELTIGKTDKLLSSWTVWEKSNPTTYTITKFTPNATIADATFTFDKSKHPKVEVIDLR